METNRHVDFELNISEIVLVKSQDAPSGFCWDAYQKCRSQWGVTCIVDGSANIEYSSGGMDTLEKFSIAIIPPTTAYRFHVPESETHCLHYTINFLTNDSLDYILDKDYAQILYLSGFTEISQLFEECIRLWTNKPVGYKMHTLGLVYQIVSLIIEGWLRNRMIDKSYSHIIPARAYILEHYDEDITIEDLANLCKLSPTHFRRLFKSALLCSPISYQLYIRLEKSKDLLHDVSLNISEIASMVGFHSANYFTRFFKERTGVTPMEYRNNI